MRGVLGGGVLFLFDAPWAPVYLGLIYLLHPLRGQLAVGSALLLFALALANDRVTRPSLRAAIAASNRAMATAEAALRNAEAVEAMDCCPV